MRQITKTATLLTFSLVCYAYAQQATQPTRVSVLQLIVTPERFDGTMISVQGFIEMSREGDLLYLHQTDSDHMITPNAIWVGRTERTDTERSKLHKKYVQVIGIFRAGYSQHLGYPHGGIPEPVDIKAWSDPANPISKRLKQLPGVTTGP